MIDKRKTRYVIASPTWLVIAALGMVNTITAHGEGSLIAYLINAFVMAFGIFGAFDKDCL